MILPRKWFFLKSTRAFSDKSSRCLAEAPETDHQGFCMDDLIFPGQDESAFFRNDRFD